METNDGKKAENEKKEKIKSKSQKRKKIRKITKGQFYFPTSQCPQFSRQQEKKNFHTYSACSSFLAPNSFQYPAFII